MVMYVVYFKNLKYFVIWLHISWWPQLIHYSEATTLLVSHFPIGRLRHMTIKVDGPCTCPVHSISIRLLHPKTFTDGKLLDLLYKLVPHMHLYLLFHGPRHCRDIDLLLCLFLVSWEGQSLDQGVELPYVWGLVNTVLLRLQWELLRLIRGVSEQLSSDFMGSISIKLNLFTLGIKCN